MEILYFLFKLVGILLLIGFAIFGALLIWFSTMVMIERFGERN